MFVRLMPLALALTSAAMMAALPGCSRSFTDSGLDTAADDRTNPAAAPDGGTVPGEDPEPGAPEGGFARPDGGVPAPADAGRPVPGDAGRPVPDGGPVVTECGVVEPPVVSEFCARSVCECNPDAASECDEACWEAIDCALSACPDISDIGCVLSNCPDAPNVASLELYMCVVQEPSCWREPSDRDPVCGDGILDATEDCEPELMVASCEAFGFTGGVLGCDSECNLDFNDCTTCGNGVAEGREECDGDDLIGGSCEGFGFGGGELSCGRNCTLNTRGCDRCGDGQITGAERCEGRDLVGQTCSSLGFGGGTLLCDDTTCGYDTSMCSLCGDGVVSAGENCDGNDLAGASCDSLGLGTGALSCDPTSCLFDSRACQQGPSCGNGVAETGEQCDGRDLANQSCESLGFDGGSLSCNVQSCRFDRSRCENDPPPEPPDGPTCTDECVERVCGEILAECAARPDCEGALECVDECRGSPDLGCVMGCLGDLESAAVALVATDCVRDCQADCTIEF